MKKQHEDFKKKLENHKQISRSAPGTAFSDYSTNAIRQEIGKKPISKKSKFTPNDGPYKKGQGLKIK